MSRVDFYVAVAHTRAKYSVETMSIYTHTEETQNVQTIYPVAQQPPI